MPRLSQQPPLLGLITCPECGNSEKFFEVIDNIVSTTLFTQNSDGSFSQEEGSREIPGSKRLFCAVCDADLTTFHLRFSEMIF